MATMSMRSGGLAHLEASFATDDHGADACPHRCMTASECTSSAQCASFCTHASVARALR